MILDGIAGSQNTTGDEQKKLDVLSNEMMVNSLYHSHACAILVSEENEDPIIVPEEMAGNFLDFLFVLINFKLSTMC